MKDIITELEQGSVLVCATARQARHWRWRFDRHQRSRGRQGWPAPAIQAWRPWLAGLWEESLLAGGEAGSLWLLTEAQAELAWRQLLMDERASGSLTVSFGRGLRMLRQSWRRLHEWGVDVPALAAAAATPDSAGFARLAAAYADLLRSRGWLDPEQLPGRLATDLRRGAVRAPRRICWLGFADLPPVLTRLDAALSGAGSLTGHAAPRRDRAERRAEAFLDRAAEQRFVVSELGRAMARDPSGCHGLVLAAPAEWNDRGLREQLLDVLEPGWRNRPGSGLPVSLSRAPAASASGLVRTALLLLKLAAGRIDYRDFGQLLRSRYLAGGEAESAGRARLDLRLRAERQPDLSLAEVLELEDSPAPQLRTLLGAVRQRQRDTGTPREPDEWVGWLEDLLAAAGWPGDRDLGEDEVIARDAWQTLLERFGSLGPVAGRMPLGAAVSWLERETSQTELAGRRREDGVQILPVVDAQGLEFETVLMPGLHAEAWPPVFSPDPLLPLALQRRAGIPEASASGQAALGAQLFGALLASAGRCGLSYAASEEDRVCAPSPAFGAKPPVPRARETVAGGPQEWLQWSGELETVVGDPCPPLAPDEPVRGGSRVLQLQARCPARAFIEIRLGAVEVPVPELGLDAAARGQLLHRAAEALYARLAELGRTPGDGGDAATEIETAVGLVLRAWSRSRHPLLPALAEIEHRRLARQLEQLMRLEAARPPFRVLATEQSFATRVAGLELGLRLDRLDELADGSRLVIDYKTGQAPSASAWTGERLLEPQLPLYAIAGGVDAIAVLQINADGVALRGVGRNDFELRGLRDVAAFTKGACEDWASLLENWRLALEAVAGEFAAGCFAIDLNERNPALGQFAPLTRAYSLRGGADT